MERPAAPPQPLQRFQGVQKESAGYRLMSAMGWREGEGLGASKQGIKAHIKVKKKFENWGVGAIEAAEHAQNWTNGMLDFHRVLSNLSEVVSEHARRGASSDDDDSDAPGQAKPEQQTRGKKQQKGKPKDSTRGKKRKQLAPSSISSSSEEEEEQDVVAAAPQRVKAATHLGRFKKREAGKAVKGYSQHDLAAIIGVDPFAAAAAAIPEVRAQHAQAPNSSGYVSDTEPSGSDSRGRRVAAGKAAQQVVPAQAQAKPKPEMIVVRRRMIDTRPSAQAPAAPQESRQPGWWQVCFHRAAGPRGAAGAASGQAALAAAAAAAVSNPAAITIHGFSEQDQTNLYNLAHDKATKGRVGLGRSSMPKKLGGALWEGKKTQIADSDDEAEQQEQADEPQEALQLVAAPAGADLEQEEGLVIILPASKHHLLAQLGGNQQQVASGLQAPPLSKKARKAAAAAAAAGSSKKAAVAAAPAEGSKLLSVKWKKAVATALAASSKGKLKLSKLHRAVSKGQGVPKAQRAAALESLTAFLQQSRKFTLTDGVVSTA
ncbi:hypothetical protein D9Q98_001930 [Chlorella vulgaris]|uniref:G-patch domain-containing protein n=1 Tax=Chlorella vulgaris TaxID=3077 RepID=A0A9D4Z0R0_CHLVU|nr:hypothetical protein D9Q98_001930 [Chlorella vulgaris]